MNTYHSYSSAQKGYSLLETLVAVVVVAVGLLAIANLQGSLIGKSAENKAKVEAMAFAQSRLDQLRNYTNSADDEAGFDALFADTSGYINSTTLNGVNATFTRDESIMAAASTKDVSVRVAWLDRHGDTQTVVMSTSLGWQSPRATGDLARLVTAPHVASPSGRAHVGEGQLPTGGPTTDNGDGTELYDDGTGDLKLVVGTDIVLTLEDACQTNGSCIDFAKINGRVYIDTATQKHLDPGEIFVTASDAAYCQRYYTSGGTTIAVTNSTTSAAATANGDYEYFDYRCYLGGGWHGNIGILLGNGLSQTDKICMGNPVSSNAWEQPTLAARRVYRGMLYRIEASSTSGKEENANGDIVYYSTGIGDSVVLPNPNTSDKPHDFVISTMPSTATTGDKCISRGVMVRPDSNLNGTGGDLFDGMPTDFICLNPGYVDSYDTGIYGVESSCPYNPADPPVTGHVFTGTITLTASESYASEVNLISVNTSDGSGNCIHDSFTWSSSTYSANYSCEVFDWGSGWTGYIEVQSNSGGIYCQDNGNDGSADHRINMSGITADGAGQDFACAIGSVNTISGVVSTVNSHKILSGATISEAGGSCTVAADGLSYSCYTGNYNAANWSGTITFATTDGYVCGTNVDPNTGIAIFTSELPGSVTRNLLIISDTNCP